MHDTWGTGGFQKLDDPVLTPLGDGWESSHVYNPAAWTDGKEVFLFYRAEGPPYRDGNRLTSSIGLAVSNDGIHFVRHPVAILSPSKDDMRNCEDPRVVRINGLFHMTYTAYDGQVARLVMATSLDGRSWEKLGNIFTDAQWDDFFTDGAWERLNRPLSRKRKQGWSKAGAILAQPLQEKYWMYFGDTHIWAAWSGDLVKWNVLPDPVLSPRVNLRKPGGGDYFDSYLVESGPPPLLIKDGIWLGYNGACIDGVSDHPEGKPRLRYSFGQVLFAKDDPARVIRRSPGPLLEPTTTHELEGQVSNVVFAEGLVSFKGRLFLYYGMADSAIGVAIASGFVGG